MSRIYMELVATLRRFCTLQIMESNELLKHILSPLRSPLILGTLILISPIPLYIWEFAIRNSCYRRRGSGRPVDQGSVQHVIQHGFEHSLNSSSYQFPSSLIDEFI